MIGRSHPSSLAACRARRSAFTLVELLVVIAIIVLLGSLTLVGLAGILADAKAARTRSQIARIDSLLMARWEQYRSRPVPVPINIATVSSTGDPSQDRANAKVLAGQAHLTRLRAMRLLQRVEFPDRISDVTITMTGAPALLSAYQRRVTNVAIATGKTWTPQYQGAECLYMILAEMNEGGKSALEFFNETEIGDVDDDGMNEVLDGWGNPIEFIRWAPGVSNQPGPDLGWGVVNVDDNGNGIIDDVDEFNPNGSDDLLGSNLSDIQFGSPVTSGDGRQGAPDPFDPFLVDANGSTGLFENFVLYPFIYSAGPDKQYGIVSDYDTANNLTLSAISNAAPTARFSFGDSSVNNDPYYRFGSVQQLGGIGPEGGYEDTLHNHQLAP